MLRSASQARKKEGVQTLVGTTNFVIRMTQAASFFVPA